MIIYLVGKFHMHTDTPVCSFSKVGIKCDWFAYAINYTHMFDEPPYNLVNTLPVSSLVNSYIQWIIMIKWINKCYIIMVLHYFGCVGARVHVVVRVARTENLTL